MAQVRRVEQFQQTTVNWLLPADMSPLEIAPGLRAGRHRRDRQHRPKRPGSLSGAGISIRVARTDHLYRYSALYERIEDKGPNNQKADHLAFVRHCLSEEINRDAGTS